MEDVAVLGSICSPTMGWGRVYSNIKKFWALLEPRKQVRRLLTAFQKTSLNVPCDQIGTHIAHIDQQKSKEKPQKSKPVQASPILLTDSSVQPLPTNVLGSRDMGANRKNEHYYPKHWVTPKILKRIEIIWSSLPHDHLNPWLPNEMKA